MKVEVCATHIETVRLAQLAGADRIELCSELSLGGITPSAGLIQTAVTQYRIPIQCLIRPRSGDFIYSENEFEIILNDIQKAKSMGVAGIVVGLMTKNNEIDWNQLEQAISVAKPLEITFHRAFDLVRNPESSLENLIAMGVDRILCSGKADQAAIGIDVLVDWKKQAGGRIEIQPGGGINMENCALFIRHQFPSLHLSAMKKKSSDAGADTLESLWQQPKEIADWETLQYVVNACH